MSFDDRMDILIQKYLLETKNKSYSLQEIALRPRWRRVYFYWRALELYENIPFPNLSLDEIKSIYGDK